jgi:hypothetical protein
MFFSLFVNVKNFKTAPIALGAMGSYCLLIVENGRAPAHMVYIWGFSIFTFSFFGVFCPQFTTKSEKKK